MKKLGRNTLAVGLSTLLVTSAVSLSASAATEFRVYSEAQTIAAADQALGLLVDPLGDALEDNGSFACENYDQLDCSGDNPAFTSSPLQALNALGVPVGDALGAEIGPVSNYALALDGVSRARSGAVGSDGIVNVGGGGTDEPLASINLLNGELDGLAGVDLTVGAVAAQADQEGTGPATTRASIAGLTVNASIPALATTIDQFETLIGQRLTEIDSIGLSTVCGLLDSALESVCSALPAGALDIGVPTVNEVTGSLAVATDDGVSVDLDDGTIAINLDTVLVAAGLDINNLPPNTDLLPFIAASLDDVIDAIIAMLTNAPTAIVNTITDNVSLSVVGIDALPEGTLTALLNPILTPLTQGLSTAGNALAENLPEVVGPDLLGQLARVIVHATQIYGDTVADRLPGTAYTSATALRVQVFGGQATDVLLGNALVGPNVPFETGDDQAAAGDDAADDAQADGTIADAAADAQADAIADADAQADADVTTSLPNAGAPNLLPFWLLGLGLVAFGAAVLVNERRRALI